MVGTSEGVGTKKQERRGKKGRGDRGLGKYRRDGRGRREDAGGRVEKGMRREGRGDKSRPHGHFYKSPPMAWVEHGVRTTM